MTGAPPAVAPAKARRLDIDRAKGLGIFLVVLGHLAAKSQPAGNVWFAYLQTAVYQFHMPFFMFLSGYVWYLSGAARTPAPKWTQMVRRRVWRFIIPFVLFGLALVAGKFAAAHFIHVDHAPDSVADALLGLVWDTDNSPAISVWYILVVFVLMIVTPPILWLTRGRTAPLLLIAAVIYLLPVPHVMYLDRIARFFIFFSLGGVAADLGKRWLDAIDTYTVAWLALFALLVAVAVYDYDGLPDTLRLFACGAASMPALHGLVRRGRFADSNVLLLLGTMTFIIYLLNTPFIGLTKGVMLKLLPWDGINFLLYLPALLAAGIVGPILTKRYVFRHMPWLDRLTD